MERLNHQAGLLLKKVAEEADRCAIQEPMSELKMLWDSLDEKIIGRQVSEGRNISLTHGIKAVKRLASLKVDGIWSGFAFHVVMV